MRWSVMAMVLGMVIGGCGTTAPTKPTQALPNDIPDMETHRQIEKDRRVVHVAETQAAEATAEEERERRAMVAYETYLVQEAERPAKRAAFNAQLPPSPEGMHTWVLQSVDMVTCGREGISMYCVETNTEPDGSFTCSDEDAERILAWFKWNEDGEKRRDWSRAVDKSFHVPNDIQEPSEALDYLLTLIRHNGLYERPSVEALRERLVESFGALEIPNVFDGVVDIARWRQTYAPLFLENIPSGPGGDVDAWGRPPALNNLFLDFQRELFTRTGIRVGIVFQKWASSSDQSIRYSHAYFITLQNERGVEVAANIDEWCGDLKRCRIASGVILGIDWDWYRSEDDEPQYGGGR